jgi:TnpA family transposase
MEDGTLIVPRLPANERPDSLIELEKLVEARLPLVELSDLLMDVDGWTAFSQELRHAANAEPRSQELLVHSHASILAQACNMGLSRMAHGAELSYERLSWCTTWYLREETLGAALSRVVNYHHHLPLSRVWGDGAFSSSDGQRFLVSVPSRTATAVRPYFGRGRGLTAATWTCDQFSQYAAKPIPAAEREATYVLDGILDNVTELPIVEHTTDTGGYTDIVFALFDLLGLQFIPRLRDVGGHRLYRFNKSTRYRHLEPLLRGQINSAKILNEWDAMLRVAGSLSGGWVTASLFMSKLQRPKKNALATALQEYGRLVKTIFVLRYIEDDALQRRVGAQLNKTEAIHALRRFLVIANDGQIRCSGYDDQVNQVACMNLVSNAIVTWNTVYIQAVLKQLRAEGHTILDADIARLSPVRSSHINPYGRYTFDVRRARPGGRLRPLRRP